MWFKMHPWVFPLIIGVIGLLYLLLNIGAIIETKKIQAEGSDHHLSGIPFLGGIHLLIAGLISPIKWLALLCILDFTFWDFLYALFIVGRSDEKKEIIHPIIAAVFLFLAFYAIEIPMVLLDVFPKQAVLYTVDFILRCIFGTVALVFMYRFYKQSGDAEGFKNVFRGKISWKVCLLLCPLFIYILLPLLKIKDGVFTTAVLGLFCINALQQVATGYYEESVFRGLVMKGLLAHRTDTLKNRLITVLISGGIFGLSHVPNIAFGENPLVQAPATMLIGIFWAAIYMCTENLPLSMCLHALSDLTPRIVGYLFSFESQPAISSFISGARNVIDYVVFPLVAFLICVFYDRIKSR